jgi:hypothetical protein
MFQPPATDVTTEAIHRSFEPADVPYPATDAEPTECDGWVNACMNEALND